jgi:hypothetical protein
MKTTKNLSEDGRSPGRCLKLGRPVYEAGELPSQPRRSVLKCRLTDRDMNESITLK